MANVNIGRTCGFLFLFVLLTSAVSGGLWATPLEPADTAGALTAIADGVVQFRSSIIIDLISHVSIIALAGALFLSFSSYSKSLALIGTLWRVVEGIILALNELVNSVLLIVAQDFVSASGTEAVALETLGHTLLITEQWSYGIGMAFFALGSLLFGILFVIKQAVPRTLAWLGVVASLIAVAETWLGLAIPTLLFGASSNPLLLVLFLPIMIYEVILGIWLLRGGLESRQVL
ncbi:MAG: DUF4386 domain-containing protein [Candidatus Thorarchaeota archaeon]